MQHCARPRLPSTAILGRAAGADHVPGSQWLAKAVVDMARPRTIAAQEKRRDALLARQRGNSWAEVARIVGYASEGAAHTAAMTALKDIPYEAANDLRRTELETLNELQLALRAKLTEKPSAFLVDSILRIMERRAKLVGLDAPISIRTEVVTVDAVDAEIQRLEAELAERSRQPAAEEIR